MLRQCIALGLAVMLAGFLAGCGSSDSPYDAPTMSERYDSGHSPLPTTGSRSLQQQGYTGAIASPVERPDTGRGPGVGGDRFDRLEEDSFVGVTTAPLSTFSVDVDTAAYAKSRMYLLERHALPPVDAVRIEEFVNYFDYDYSPPAGDDPFAVHMEITEAPWRPSHRLARIGIQGRNIDRKRSASNLIFLLDVSGSMDQPNKLPLVKRGLQMLVSKLGENDRVALVVYAGAAGLVLPSTTGRQKHVILAPLASLHAGGSTNGGAGIELAYGLARENYVPGGVNRVILCTDGDFNVGTTSTSELIRLATEQAKSGVYLSVLGFGMGNHNDSMLEQLSNRANGNYAFIDSEREARKVLLDQLDGTLATIAKDVKIQVEFNPASVAAYRLIGYENRRLNKRDFLDDTKDAGDIGAGHSVTALYEVIPVGAADERTSIDPLKYQRPRPLSGSARSDELMTVKLRYKHPEGQESRMSVFAVADAPARFVDASRDLRFAAAVAAFGMLLRDSPHRGTTTFDTVLEIAAAARGPDMRGYRGEFLEMVTAAKRLRGEVTTPLGSVLPASPYTASYRGITPAANVHTGHNGHERPPSHFVSHLIWIVPLAVGVMLWGVFAGVLVCVLGARLAVAPRSPMRFPAK